MNPTTMAPRSSTSTCIDIETALRPQKRKQKPSIIGFLIKDPKQGPERCFALNLGYQAKLLTPMPGKEAIARGIIVRLPLHLLKKGIQPASLYILEAKVAGLPCKLKLLELLTRIALLLPFKHGRKQIQPCPTRLRVWEPVSSCGDP